MITKQSYISSFVKLHHYMHSFCSLVIKHSLDKLKSLFMKYYWRIMFCKKTSQESTTTLLCIPPCVQSLNHISGFFSYFNLEKWIINIGYTLIKMHIQKSPRHLKYTFLIWNIRSVFRTLSKTSKTTLAKIVNNFSEWVQNK